MLKKLLLLFLSFFGSMHAQTKTIYAVPINSFAIDAERYFGFDVLENYYYEKNNVLIKENKTIKWVYQNNSLGKISSISFQNPLRILVFYEEFNTVLFLDSQLNEIQKIDFSSIENPLIVSKVGMATQNQIWLFDAALNQLFLYNYVTSIRTKVCQPVQNKWLYYQSNFTNFYWVSDKNEWESCSIIGKNQVIKKLPNWNKIQFIDEDFFLYKINSDLFLSAITKGETYQIENVDNSLTDLYWRDQILSIFTNQQITNYKITLP